MHTFERRVRAKWARALGAIVLIVAISGCRMRQSISIIDPLRGGDTQPQPWDAVLATRLNRPYDDVRIARSRYFNSHNALERRSLRDAIAFAALALIDEHHHRSAIRLATLRSGNDAAADLAVIGLSTAATLSSGEALKSALAATASAVTGANLSINEHLLHEQTTAAILSQMGAEHAERRVMILQRLRAQDDAAYPLAAVDLDLLECLYAGSPVQAIASLAEAAALRRAAVNRMQHAVGDQ